MVYAWYKYELSAIATTKMSPYVVSGNPTKTSCSPGVLASMASFSAYSGYRSIRLTMKMIVYA